MDQTDDYMTYPTPFGRRGGSKVSWYFYKTIEEASACSDAARHNAELMRVRGFDFGFNYPGNIHKISELDKNNPGAYEVCIC